MPVPLPRVRLAASERLRLHEIGHDDQSLRIPVRTCHQLQDGRLARIEYLDLIGPDALRLAHTIMEAPAAGLQIDIVAPLQGAQIAKYRATHAGVPSQGGIAVARQGRTAEIAGRVLSYLPL